MINLTLSPTLLRKVDKVAAASRKTREDAAADLIRWVITPRSGRSSRSGKPSTMPGDNTPATVAG